MDRVVALLITSTALVACGDDGSSVTIVDGGGGDSGPVTCLASSAYGAVTPTTQEAHSALNMDGMTDYWVFLDLNQEAMPDVLLVDLYTGFGAFETGIPATGATVQLTGAESSFDSCGACVSIQVDYTDAGPADDKYIADGGTMNLTSATAMTFSGNLSNVTFRHVNVDADGVATPHPDGCTATLSSIAFSAMPVPDMAAAPSRFHTQSKRRR